MPELARMHRDDVLARPEDKPRVALISPWYPEPVDNGSKQRLRCLIDALSGDYDLMLVALLEGTGPTNELSPVPGILEHRVFQFPHYAARSVRGFAAAASRYPRSFVATWDPALARTVRQAVERFEADLVIGTDLRVLRYATTLRDLVPVVADETLVSPFFGYGAERSSRGQSLRSALRTRKYRYLLDIELSKVDIAIVPSDEEATLLQNASPNVDLRVISNGVGSVPPLPWSVPAGSTAIYTGSLTYSANADAVEFFARDILDRVTTDVPDFALTVTGALPESTAGLEAIVRHPAIHLTGRLNDLEGALRSSRLFVAPIRTGTGTRIKLLEAMALGMPIVSTRKGAEGLAVQDGVHLRFADAPEDFARTTLALLDDFGECLRLGRNARALVQERYCWTDLGQRLRAIAGELINRPTETHVQTGARRIAVYQP